MIDNLSIDGTIPMDVFCKHVTSVNHDSPLHVHTHHIELLLIRSGNASFYTEHQAFPIPPRTLIIIPNGVWHCVLTHDSTPYERVCLNIDTNLIANISTNTTNLFNCFYDALTQEVSTRFLDESQNAEFTNACDKLVEIIDHKEYAYDIYERIELSKILLFANKTTNLKQHRVNQIPKLLEKNH
ncbi:AraC family ligand binding domain-containing protein [Lentilactobacillus sp. Marseille-Q4993]|uniref:AraC family ligand binding domain-containing protein n=1 Tax=Lentilactobacillus sp. Marseille-Q4993 TaxID=3039492 RepID=UPI0024BCF990|nr:AraC family ligand binding domain-containing protein [Lentilactobacillus sp. Marseille-Q4993]